MSQFIEYIKNKKREFKVIKVSLFLGLFFFICELFVNYYNSNLWFLYHIDVGSDAWANIMFSFEDNTVDWQTHVGGLSDLNSYDKFTLENRFLNLYYMIDPQSNEVKYYILFVEGGIRFMSAEKFPLEIYFGEDYVFYKVGGKG